MSYSAEPGHVEQFRVATDNHEKMRGTMFLTFRCPECGHSKSTKCRKSRGLKIGFRFLDCHMEKSAAKSADKNNATVSGL